MTRKVVLVLALLIPAVVNAQKHVVTIGEIYDPAKRVQFAGPEQTNIQWLDETRFVWAKTGANRKVTDVLMVNAATGRSQPLFDTAKLETALQKEAGVTEAEARAITHQSRYPITPAGSALLLSAKDDLYVFEIAANRLRRVTSTPGREEEFDFSPDGTRISFILKHDLWVVDTAQPQHARRLTTDGGDDVLNGMLDWLYQEEIYGRGDFRAYWWSPDSRSLAFLRLDESHVPAHTIIDDIPYEQTVTTTRYPKAGEPNPVAKLFVVDALGAAPRDLTPDSYAPDDLLIVNVSWKPDSSAVIFQAANREQTRLDLDSANPASREVKTILREASPAWVEVIGSPRWLPDGTFLWLSERSGFRHLFQVREDGSVVRQITSGEWEVRDLKGLDRANGTIYVTANERDPVGVDLYRVHVDGSGFSRISEPPGQHTPWFNDAATRYVDSWSDISTPPQLRSHDTKRRESILLDANPSPALEKLVLSRPEFLQVKSRDGFPMNAMIIKPVGFDPSSRYPVFQYLYGGPHAPVVANAWNGTSYLFLQAIAQQGVVVWMCDNRSAAGTSMNATWTSYKQFGTLELRDIEDGVAWLKQQPWIDGGRVMLYGWSFGGFMTSYALTHSTTFVAGIAGAPVTDWRDYDSVYTERYMLTPQHNPDGYRESSPRFAAGNLHGGLLLVHGTMDDNVHLQNSVGFAYELQKAGKAFRMMVYPNSKHGVTEPPLVAHLRSMMFDFILENLKPVR